MGGPVMGRQQEVGDYTKSTHLYYTFEVKVSGTPDSEPGEPGTQDVIHRKGYLPTEVVCRDVTR